MEQIKPAQPVVQAAECKYESKFVPLPVIWQSDDHSRRLFRRQSKVLTAKSNAELFSSAPAQLCLVGQANTNTVFLLLPVLEKP